MPTTCAARCGCRVTVRWPRPAVAVLVSAAGRSGRPVCPSTVSGAAGACSAWPGPHGFRRRGSDLGNERSSRAQGPGCRRRSTGFRTTGTARSPDAELDDARSPPGWSPPAADTSRPAACGTRPATWPMSMAYTWVRPPSVNGGLSAGAVSESRSRAVMSTVPVGGGACDGRDRGAPSGFTKPRSTSTTGPPSTAKGPAPRRRARPDDPGRASTGGTGR